MAETIKTEVAIDNFLSYRYGYFPDTYIAMLKILLKDLTAEQIAMLSSIPLDTPPNGNAVYSVFSGFLGLNRFKERHIDIGIFKLIYTVMLLFILPFGIVMLRFWANYTGEISSYGSQAKEMLRADMSFNKVFSYSLEWMADDPSVIIVPLLIFGVITIALYIIDGKKIVEDIKYRNYENTREDIKKIKSGDIAVSEEAVAPFMKDLYQKSAMASKQQPVTNRPIAYSNRQAKTTDTPALFKDPDNTAVLGREASDTPALLKESDNTALSGRINKEQISETAHTIAKAATNAAEVAAAEAKTIAEAGLPYLKEFVKHPVSAVRDYSMGLKECLAIAALQAIAAAFTSLVIASKSSLFRAILSVSASQKAGLFFKVFFVSLFGAALLYGLIWLFGKIFRGVITGDNANARLLSGAATVQIPMTAALLVSIVMGLIYSPVVIALVVFGLMAGVVLTVIVYRETFGLTEDYAMYAAVATWTVQVIALLLIMGN